LSGIAGNAGTGRETVRLYDNNSNSAFITIDAYDTAVDDYGGADLESTPSHCVYIHSKNAAGTTEYPFKFRKLLVDELTVNTLNASIAFKETVNLTLVNADTASFASTRASLLPVDVAYVDFNNADNQSGISFKFSDNNASPADSNHAWILHPHSGSGTEFSSTNFKNSLVFSNKIAFANLNGPGTLTPTPTIGWGNLIGGILVKSTSEKSFIKFENDDTQDDFGNIGVRNGYSYFTFGDNVIFKLNTNPVVYGVNSFTITNDTNDQVAPTDGLKFELETYSGYAGKLAVIDSVSAGGLATVKFKSIIKALNTQDASDPIGTLYYVPA